MDVDSEESDEEYVADSNDSSSEEDEKEEFVPETSVDASVRYLLPAPQLILTLSVVPSHYHILDLDAMHEDTTFFNMGTCDCDLFQSFHFPCHHVLATCAAASVEWGTYVHMVYRQEVVLKVVEPEEAVRTVGDPVSAVVVVVDDVGPHYGCSTVHKDMDEFDNEVV
ncbi:hypothetical protein Ahy_A08g038425 [Arachis hypogaea]|uniref:SWIM-type domain-containing protein n=1 Tax=Arachis hypogaea TaxID=3818 RepID=A0A445BTD4_ARAHY|nr:hypothetical protein Ahy_A08g038425 [Arachis hypogaea]